MDVEVMRVSAFMYEQKYIEFVLNHYKKLNMPYPFSVAFGYMASPVLMDEEIFLALDEEHQVIGCLSYIRGTAQHNYEDREIVQIQLVYIEEGYRSTSLLLQLFSIMQQCLRYMEEPVKEIQFWSKEDEQLQMLIAKRFNIAPQSHRSIYGPLHYYALPYEQVEQYLSQFPQIQYF